MKTPITNDPKIIFAPSRKKFGRILADVSGFIIRDYQRHYTSDISNVNHSSFARHAQYLFYGGNALGCADKTLFQHSAHALGLGLAFNIIRGCVFHD